MIRRMVLGMAVVAGGTLGFAAGSASAHPLGNLTVNTSAHVVVAPEAVTVRYVLDLAELPTVQERPTLSAAGSEGAYAGSKCASLAAGVVLTAGGEPVALTVASSTMALLPGQGGLSTLRVECTLVGAGVRGHATLGWHDANFTDRLGWREVVASGDGTTLTTDLPSASSSDFLLAYPGGVPAPRVFDAAISVRPGGPRLSGSGTAAAGATAEPQRRGADGLTAFFNRLVGDRDLTLGLALAAMGVAFVLGAMHSLAPGHGKTLMAAMVASRRGTIPQVLTVGATVALTHTLGVVVLGIVITTSQAVAPDHVLPWLTVASGGLLLATGVWLLARRMLFGTAGGHSHGTFGHGHHHHGHHHHGHHHHDHHHHDHSHGDGPGHHHHHGPVDHGHGHGHEDPVGPAERPLRTRSLALIGMAGGLVPTPSALVVLLGATALGRAWFGVVLVGVYGVGMAATLLAAGVLLVKLQGWLERQYAQARWLDLSMRLLPVATSVLLILGGLSLALRGAVSL